MKRGLAESGCIGGEAQAVREARRWEWMTQVQALTMAPTLVRARAIEVAGLAPESKPGVGRFEVQGVETAETVDLGHVEGVEINKWHAARANGLRQKWDRIRTCGESRDFVVARCSRDCAQNGGARRIGCGHRECPTCRPEIARRIQRDVVRARRSLTNAALEAKANRLLRERFLTLTAPHYASANGVPASRRRVAIIYEAWKAFGDWLRRYMKENSEFPELCHSWRMFEWTEGEDGLGHPHFHVWIHGPWLDRVALHDAWERALKNASGEDRPVLAPDVRLVRGSAIEKELVKYMLKDLSNGSWNEFINPVVAAHVLEELNGRRRRQTSRGIRFWIELNLKRITVCRCCGQAFNFGFGRTPHPRGEAPPGRPPPVPKEPGVVMSWHMPKVAPPLAQLALFR